MSDILEECTRFFRSNRGFERLFLEMKNKYKSFGTVSGTIVIENLSNEEKSALEGLLKKDLSRVSDFSIKAQSIRKSLDKTKFNGISLEELLFEYYGEEFYSNRQVKEAFKERRSEFFQRLIQKYKDGAAGSWLKSIFDNEDNAYRIMLQKYSIDKSDLENAIDKVAIAVKMLPIYRDEKVRFPFFAASVTKNPHSFDQNELAGTLLTYALMYMFEVEKPANAEKRAELYYSAGILVDDVSNYILCSGLLGYTVDGLHDGWTAFYKSSEPMMITLSNLSRVKRITSEWGKVFVVENAGVFAAIKDSLGNKNAPLICTYGQLKIAGLVMLDFLSKEGTEIYYSGDYDPEGLMIADRLYERYGDRVVWWRYEKEDYLKSISDEKLGSYRIKKMKGLKNLELKELAIAIEEKGLAGYQEFVIYDLVSDILRGLG